MLGVAVYIDDKRPSTRRYTTSLRSHGPVSLLLLQLRLSIVLFSVQIVFYHIARSLLRDLNDLLLGIIATLALSLQLLDVLDGVALNSL